MIEPVPSEHHTSRQRGPPHVTHRNPPEVRWSTVAPDSRPRRDRPSATRRPDSAPQLPHDVSRPPRGEPSSAAPSVGAHPRLGAPRRQHQPVSCAARSAHLRTSRHRTHLHRRSRHRAPQRRRRSEPVQRTVRPPDHHTPHRPAPHTRQIRGRHDLTRRHPPEMTHRLLNPHTNRVTAHRTLPRLNPTGQPDRNSDTKIMPENPTRQPPTRQKPQTPPPPAQTPHPPPPNPTTPPNPNYLHQPSIGGSCPRISHSPWSSSPLSVARIAWCRRPVGPCRHPPAARGPSSSTSSTRDGSRSLVGGRSIGGLTASSTRL